MRRRTSEKEDEESESRESGGFDFKAPVVYAVIVTRRIGLDSGYSGGDAARRISGLREGVDVPSRLGVLLSCFGEHDSDT